jgi:hypothetical protein
MKYFILMEETYVAQTMATPPPSVIEQPKKGFPKWILALLLVILFLIVGAGVYFLTQTTAIKLTQNTESLGAAKLTPTPTISSTNPKDHAESTSNWNTYSPSNGTYSFKYPSDGNWKMSGSSTVVAQCAPASCQKPINIRNFTVVKSDKTSLQQYISSLNTTNSKITPYIEDYKFIKINGFDAVEILTPGDPESGTGPTVSIFIVIDGVGYLYSYTYLDPNLNSVTKLDQLPDPNPNILSTLEINGKTTTTNTATDWKVYTNNTLGVTLKYPPTWFVDDGKEIKNCAKFSDSSDFAPPYSHTVISFCTHPEPIQGSDASNQITLNGYQGIRVNQTSNWGVGQKVLLSNPKGGSIEFGLSIGDTGVYDLILSTFRFIQ